MDHLLLIPTPVYFSSPDPPLVILPSMYYYSVDLLEIQSPLYFSAPDLLVMLPQMYYSAPYLHILLSTMYYFNVDVLLHIRSPSITTNQFIISFQISLHNYIKWIHSRRFATSHYVNHLILDYMLILPPMNHSASYLLAQLSPMYYSNPDLLVILPPMLYYFYCNILLPILLNY